MYRLLILAVSLLFCSAIQSQESLKKEIEKIVYHDTDVHLSEHPNVLIGIVDNGVRSFVQFSNNDVLDTTAVFEIGSVTKPFISGYISYLEENNFLNKTDEIIQYISELKGSSIEHVNIQELLNGNVNFSRYPNNLGIYEKDSGDPYRYYEKEAMIDYIFANKFKITKNAHYSHIGYALLEYIIEEVTGKKYSVSISEYLVNVLNLQNTGFDLIPTQGYRRNGNLAFPRNFATFATSEGLKSNISDLLDLIEYQLGSDSKHSFLASSMDHQKKSTLGKDIFQSEGWVIYKKYAKSDLYLFTGKSDGHSAEVCFLPATKTGVVILANTSFGTQNLPYLILRMINNQWKRKTDE